MRWNVATHHSARSDHRAFADSHVGQNDAMRSNENILFNDHFSIADWSSGTRIEMCNDRSSKTDRAVVTDCDVCWMHFVDIDKLANPYVLSDASAADAMQPGSYAETSWCK